MAQNQALAIIKPDAVKNGHIGEILSAYEREGFEIVAIELRNMLDYEARQLYRHHSSQPWFEDLVRFMISEPCVLSVIEGDEVIRRHRDLIGPADPAKAPPGSLRARFGGGLPNNAVHGSDSPEAADREIGLFFPEIQRDILNRSFNLPP